MFVLVIVSSSITLFGQSTSASRSIPLLSQQELVPYGLKRDWFHQIKFHTGGEIRDIYLEGGQLFITTSNAMLHVLHSETGQGLWSRTVGNRGIPLTEPAVNSRVVAVHNNLEVFLFHRQTGKQLLHFTLPESAAAPCELSEHYLYVPMSNQTLLVYPLREAHTPQPIPGQNSDVAEPINLFEDPEIAKIVHQFEETKRLLQTADAGAENPTDRFMLDGKHRIPITTPAFGTLTTKPVLVSQFYTWVLDEAEEPTHEVYAGSHQEFLTWVTEQGFLYTARLTRLSEVGMAMVYRIDSAGQLFFVDNTQTVQIDRPGSKELVSRPTHSQIYPVNELNPDFIILPDIIVSGGRSAYAFAINGRTGDVRWQYPTQGQILEPIAVIGTDVYVSTSNGVLHALDLLTGKERWAVRHIKSFVASSKNRIYVLDRQNRLVGLDRASGESLFAYNVNRFDHCFFNLETDQIFLVTDSGLVQCLRERQISSDQELEAGANLSLRHRISCAEFIDVVNGNETPRLWWLEEANILQE